MGTRISISRLFYLEQSSVSKLNLRFSKLPTWCLSVWGHLLNLSSIKLRWPSMQTFKLLFKMRCPFIFKHSLQLSFPASVPLLSLPLSLGCRSPPSHFKDPIQFQFLHEEILDLLRGKWHSKHILPTFPAYWKYCLFTSDICSFLSYSECMHQCIYGFPFA